MYKNFINCFFFFSLCLKISNSYFYFFFMALQILLQPEGGSVSHLQAKGFFFFKKLLSLHLIMVALSETNHSDGY